MTIEEEFARLSAQGDQAVSEIANLYLGFYQRLRTGGMREDHAFEMTREYLASTMAASRRAGEDED